MTDERLKEIGEMLAKAPQKDAVTQDIYGNTVIIYNAGVAPELYEALVKERFLTARLKAYIEDLRSART